VEVSRSASQLRDPDDPDRRLDAGRDDVVVLYSRRTRPLCESFGVVTLDDCLRQVAFSEPLPEAVAIIDSAIRRTPIGRFDLEAIKKKLPKRARLAVNLASGLPESGTESVLFVILEQVGLSPRAQVPIPLTDFDRLDIVIGDRLVIECDSEEYHGGLRNRLRDLRRDAELAALGFIVLRFDYHQVFFELDAVLAAIHT
jgi:very-short-patch-repair endonuclease